MGFSSSIKRMELSEVGERVYAAECIIKRRVRKVEYIFLPNLLEDEKKILLYYCVLEQLALVS